MATSKAALSVTNLYRNVSVIDQLHHVDEVIAPTAGVAVSVAVSMCS